MIINFPHQEKKKRTSFLLDFRCYHFKITVDSCEIISGYHPLQVTFGLHYIISWLQYLNCTLISHSNNQGPERQVLFTCSWLTLCSTPGIPCGPQSTARSNFWVESKVNPEDCWLWLKTKIKKRTHQASVFYNLVTERQNSFKFQLTSTCL